MRNIFRMYGYTPERGEFEYSAGNPQQVTLISSLCKLGGNNKAWMVGAYVVNKVITANAAVAMSVNFTTGRMYLTDALVCEWDPAVYKIWWAFSVVGNLYTANQACTISGGINNTYLTNITTTLANYAYSEVNPGRTAINALAAGAAQLMYVGFYQFNP